MINEKLQDEFNVQINKELYSEYLYLAMKTYFMEQNLMGFVNWFDVQVQEEHAHAMGMFDYLNERGGKIELLPIEKPEFSGKTPLEIFEEVLKHEQYVTSRINTVYDVAEEVRDRAAMKFLNWYIDEQVEEEDQTREIVDRLAMVGDNMNGLFVIDNQLGARK